MKGKLSFSKLQPPPSGSNRNFIRLQSGEDSFILLISKDREDFRNYLRFRDLLESLGINVPQLYDRLELETLQLALLEDCGEKSLYDLWVDGSPLNKLEKYYLETLRNISKLWLSDRSVFGDLPHFIPEVISWEVSYFTENVLDKFLGKYGWIVGYLRDVSHSFSKLIAEFTTPIHRDLQSQNIILFKDTVKIIDFQSVHLSSPLYDLASLLKDPYVQIPQSLEWKLLDLASNILRPHIKLDGYGYNIAAAHRLAQASGAYVKLTTLDNKPHFLRFLKTSLPRLTKALHSLGIDLPKRLEREIVNLI